MSAPETCAAVPLPYCRPLAQRRSAARRRMSEARKLTPGFKIALRQLALGRLVMVGSWFVSPDFPGRISTEVARRLYRAGLVRFASTVTGIFLDLTDYGRRMAAALSMPPRSTGP